MCSFGRMTSSNIPHWRVSTSAFLALALTSLVARAASEADDVTVAHISGGSIRTELSASIVVNQDSNIQREWVIINHKRLPVVLSGSAGVKTVYHERTSGYSGEYEYLALPKLTFSIPVSAIEIRFILFNIWGERTKSLVTTEIKEFAPGITYDLAPSWNIYSENETSEFYASIAYVARIRTADGRILVADPSPVLGEARKFYAKFAESDLEPSKPAPKDGK